MRVMVDTNVLFSAILFPNGQAAKILYKCLTAHEIVIPSYVIGELKRVIQKKYPSKLYAIDLFLKSYPLTWFILPRILKTVFSESAIQRITPFSIQLSLKTLT